MLGILRLFALKCTTAGKSIPEVVKLMVPDRLMSISVRLSLSLTRPGVGGCCSSDLLLSGAWVRGAPGSLQLQPFHK